MEYSRLDSKEKILFTPGPLTTSLRVKQAMLTDVGSRDEDFAHLVRLIEEKLLSEDRKNKPLFFFLPLYTGKHLVQKVHISPLMAQLLLVNPEVKVAWGLVVRKPRGRRLIFYEFLRY